MCVRACAAFIHSCVRVCWLLHVALVFVGQSHSHAALRGGKHALILWLVLVCSVGSSHCVADAFNIFVGVGVAFVVGLALLGWMALALQNYYKL